MLKSFDHLKRYIFLHDIVILNLSAFLVLYFRYTSELYPIDKSHFPLTELGIFTLFSFAITYVFRQQGLYRPRIFLSFVDQLVSIAKSLAYGIAMMLIYSFFMKGHFALESRLVILLFFSISLNLFLFTRCLLLPRFYSKYLQERIRLSHIIIIGAGRAGKELAGKFVAAENIRVEIVGFLDDDTAIHGKRIFNSPIIGAIKKISDIVQTNEIDEIFIAINSISNEDLQNIIKLCKSTGKQITVISDRFKVIPEKVENVRQFGINTTELLPQPIQNFYLTLKQVLDFILALLGIVFLSPLLIVISILIKTTSRGSVLYMQDRVGKDGKPFRFYKFRSMKIDNDQGVHVDKAVRWVKNEINTEVEELKPENDPRVTAVGRFIRRTSIDELPQLLNVLKGDMSLVGPRPGMLYEYQEYENWHLERLSVKPGCTGLWQVSGRSAVNFNDMVILDLYYINNLSFWLDLKIMLKTLPVMLFSSGGK